MLIFSQKIVYFYLDNNLMGGIIMRSAIICFIFLFLFISCKDEGNLPLNPYNPVSPWGITYDGENLWVTDDGLNMIYKLDLELNLKDSFAIAKPYIRGIDFIDDKLLVVSDSSVGDSVGDFFVYGKYYIYEVDRSNGAIIDSILILVIPAGMPAGNFLWGVTGFDSNLYVSYNGGWGPCMLEIKTGSGEMNSLCCAHPLGMTVINDTLWSARYGSRFLVPIRVFNNGTSEIDSLRYELGFQATELAFDGEDVWVVDSDSSLIRKITDLR
jgi:hypothetical protein